SPGLDLRVRNDMPDPLSLAVSVDARAGTIDVELWGVGDGRSIAVLGPTIRNRRPPPADTWRYDAALGAGDSHRVAAGGEGMDVTISRVVLAADGRPLHQDSFKAHYDPRAGLYLYGPGVTPPDG